MLACGDRCERPFETRDGTDRTATTRGPSKRRPARRLPPALTHPTRLCCHPHAPPRTPLERPYAPRPSSAVGRSRTRTRRPPRARSTPQSSASALRRRDEPVARVLEDRIRQHQRLGCFLRLLLLQHLG